MDEIIRLEVDQDDITRAAEKGNRALESVEKQADKTGAAVAHSLDTAGQATVRIIDNSLRSNRRLAEDAVKQANKIGTTGVQQAEARRDAILKKIGGDPVNTEIVIEAYKKIIGHERGLEAQIRRTALARTASASNQGEIARIQQTIRLREQQGAAQAAAAAKTVAAENDIRLAAERAAAAIRKEEIAIEQATVALERRAALAGKTPIERIQIEGRNAVADARFGFLSDQDIDRRAAAYARLAEVQRQADNSILLAKAQAGSARAAKASEDFAKALNQVNTAAQREREAIEQETRALERRAQVIGKTPIQRATIEGNRTIADLTARGATPEQIQRATKAHGELIAAQRNLQDSNASTGQSLIALAGQLGLVVSAAAAVKFVFQDVILGSALYAARTEQLGVALTAVTRANGLAEITIGGLEARIKKLGITTQEARGALSRLIAGGIDTNKAEQLARLAQNVGRVAGIPSSDAFERIVHAVITLQPELFKYLGLNVSLEQAYKRVAAEQGRQLGSFTELEKRNIALNEALIVGTSYNGVYADSLKTAGGQILSFDRYIKEARNSLGNELLPILTATVTLLNSVGKGGETAGEILGQMVKRTSGEALFPGFGKFIPEMLSFLKFMRGEIEDITTTPGKSLRALDAQITVLSAARAAALKKARDPGNFAELERARELEREILDLRKQRVGAQVEDKLRGLQHPDEETGLAIIERDKKRRLDAIEKERDAREKLIKDIAAAEKDARRDLQQAQLQEVEGLERIRLQHRFTIVNAEKEGTASAVVRDIRKEILDIHLRTATASALSKSESFREQSVAKELTGLERIAELRRKGIEEVKKEKLAPPDEAKNIAIRQEGINALTDKHHADVLKKSEDFLHQSTKQEAEGFDKIAEIRRKQLDDAKGNTAAIANVNAGILALEKKLTDDLAQELARRAHQRALLTADAERDAQLRGVQLLEAQSIEVGSQNDARILARKAQLEEAKTSIVQAHILKRAELELAASIEQETRDVNAVQGLKQKEEIAARAGIQRREITQKAEIAFDASREELVIRTANLIRDQQQRIFDSIRQSADGLFDSMLQGAKSFGDALKRILIAALLTPVKQAFSNAVATLLTGVQSAQAQGGGGGTGGLFGKLGLGALLGGGGFGGGGFSRPGAPGGTGGFAGPVRSLATLPLAGLGTGFGLPGTVGATGAGKGGLLSGILGAGGLSGLFNSGSISLGAGAATTAAGIGGPLGALAGFATSTAGLGAGLALLGFGLKRGGNSGLAMSIGGGALTGAALGTMIFPGLGTVAGAAIGAIAGGIAGLVRKYTQTATEKVVAKTKAIYGIDIATNFARDPLLAIIKSQFGGNIEVGLRSPQVIELLKLYGMATGQPLGGSLAPRAVPVLFSQRGGVLSSAPIFDNGSLIGASRVVTNSIQAVQGLKEKLEIAQTAAIEGFQGQLDSVHARAIAGMGITSNSDAAGTVAPGQSGLFGLFKRKLPLPVALSFSQLIPRLGLPNVLASPPQAVQAAPVQPITIVVQNSLPAESVGNYMRGEIVETVSHTQAGHQAVANASLAANRASMNRRQITALQIAPGMITG